MSTSQYSICLLLSLTVGEKGFAELILFTCISEPMLGPAGTQSQTTPCPSHTQSHQPTPQKRSSARTVIVENSVCRHLVKPYTAGRLSLKNHIDGNDMVMAFKHMSCELKMIFVFKFVHK